MSRSGYRDGLDDWDLIRWRGAVASAIRGKRGQAFLRDLIAALDEMPERRLVAGALKVEMGDQLQDEWGEPWGPKTEEHCGVCALGALGQARGMTGGEMKAIRPDDREALSDTFGIAEALVAEVMWVNDEIWGDTSPERRWRVVRDWAENQLLPPREAPEVAER